MEPQHSTDEPFAQLWSSIDDRLVIVEAVSAGDDERAAAMDPEAAAWHWRGHGFDRDEDEREHRVQRLRSGLDLLIVHEPTRGDTSRRAR